MNLEKDEFKIKNGKKVCLLCENEITEGATFGNLLDAILGYIKNRNDEEFKRRLESHNVGSQSNDLALDRKFKKV